MKTRIVHIAIVMTLVIGVICLNTPKADAVDIRKIAIIFRAIGMVFPQQQPLPPPPINPPTGSVVRPPVSTGPPPSRPPTPKPPKPARPPLPRPNPGVGATRPGRSLLGRVANGKYIRSGGRFIATGARVLGPIGIVFLAVDGGRLLAAGMDAMERDADRVMAQNVATAEDCYRNPGKCGYSGRFDAPSGSFQSLYNATRPY